MELKEYLWRNDLHAKEFAAKAGLSQATILFVMKKRVTPRLDTAFKIRDATGGQVTFEDMLVNPQSESQEIIEKDVGE